MHIPKKIKESFFIHAIRLNSCPVGDLASYVQARFLLTSLNTIFISIFFCNFLVAKNCTDFNEIPLVEKVFKKISIKLLF